MTQEALARAVSVIDFTIGENVDTMRRRSGLTTAALGERFGVSASAMSLKLRGQRSWSAQDLHDASRLFSVRIAVLIGEEPLPDPSAPAVVSDFAVARAKRSLVRRELESRPLD